MLRICRVLFVVVATALSLFSEINCNAGVVETLTFNSKFLKREYLASVYLPHGYKTSGLRYPVLYLLHGPTGDQNSWLEDGKIKQTADELTTAGKIQPTIIIMPSHFNAWWVDGNREPAETVFFEELIPAVEKNYRTINDRSGRAVAGVSAGGYGAVLYILKHPEMFGAGAALSPAIYVPLPPKDSAAIRSHAFIDAKGKFEEETWKRLNYPKYINDYFNKGIKVPFFISSGDHDKFDIVYHAAVFYNRMRNHQPELVELRVVDGDHEWSVWSESVREALTYMLRFLSKPVE